MTDFMTSFTAPLTREFPLVSRFIRPSFRPIRARNSKNKLWRGLSLNCQEWSRLSSMNFDDGHETYPKDT